MASPAIRLWSIFVEVCFVEWCGVLRENPKLFVSSDKSEIGRRRLAEF
nr:MAG TPA: hypothetical protein [Caudoviricetes sp.]